MSCARVLYRPVAYLQFIYGHVLLPEFSQILFPWNCGFLELASSVAGTKPFLCLIYFSEVVSLKQYFCSLEQSSFCADWAGEETSLLIQYLNTYMVHFPVQQTGRRPDPSNSIFQRWTGFSQARREFATENSRKEPRGIPCFGSEAKSFYAITWWPEKSIPLFHRTHATTNLAFRAPDNTAVPFLPILILPNLSPSSKW